MYITYIPTGTATGAEVWQDFCDILQGVPITNLTQSCNKVSSSVLASVVATPWTMHDAAASASSKVLKALNADGTYKYLNVSYSATNITLMLYETWNASTHTGTNEAMYSTSISATPQLQTITTVGFTIIANLRTTLFVQRLADTTIRGYIAGEFSRESATLDTTYPCAFLAGITQTTFAQSGNTVTATGLSCVGLCRVKYAGAVGDVKKASSPAVTQPMHGLVAMGSGLVIHVPTTTTVRPAGTEAVTYMARPFYVASCLGLLSNVHILGQVPELVNLTVTSNYLDEIDVAGTRYVILPNILIPKV